MMKQYAVILLALSGLAGADPLDIENIHADPAAASASNVKLIAVTETSTYGSDNPLAARIRNDTGAYIDRLVLDCVVFDDRGYRVFRDITFKSAPLFSIGFEFPFIKTWEIGLPPDAEADVQLYTDDTRWMRGHGGFTYDCHVAAVSTER